MNTNEPEFDPDEIDDDEIIGYHCLGCGNTQTNPGECNTCCGNALEEMYF